MLLTNNLAQFGNHDTKAKQTILESSKFKKAKRAEVEVTTTSETSLCCPAFPRVHKTLKWSSRHGAPIPKIGPVKRRSLVSDRTVARAILTASNGVLARSSLELACYLENFFNFSQFWENFFNFSRFFWRISSVFRCFWDFFLQFFAVYGRISSIFRCF